MGCIKEEFWYWGALVLRDCEQVSAFSSYKRDIVFIILECQADLPQGERWLYLYFLEHKQICSRKRCTYLCKSACYANIFEKSIWSKLAINAF